MKSRYPRTGGGPVALLIFITLAVLAPAAENAASFYVVKNLRALWHPEPRRLHLRRLREARRDLNAPWGLAMAPAAGFGPFSGDLLVGNFGDGRINAFDGTTHAPKGPLMDRMRAPIVIDGLWGIAFGNGAVAGPPTVLYFAAGPADETHGLFGSIRAGQTRN